MTGAHPTIPSSVPPYSDVDTSSLGQREVICMLIIALTLYLSCMLCVGRGGKGGEGRWGGRGHDGVHKSRGDSRGSHGGNQIITT